MTMIVFNLFIRKFGDCFKLCIKNVQYSVTNFCARCLQVESKGPARTSRVTRTTLDSTMYPDQNPALCASATMEIQSGARRSSANYRRYETMLFSHR